MMGIAMTILGLALVGTIIVWGQYLQCKLDREDREVLSRMNKSVCKRIAHDTRLEIWRSHYRHQSDRDVMGDSAGVVDSFVKSPWR
jgi:hypothetical protein